MSENPDLLTVSMNALRAELGQLELRLVDRLNVSLEKKADQQHIDQLEVRVKTLEESRAARDHLPSELISLEQRMGALERFRYSVPSLALLSLVVSVGVLVYYLTLVHHK